MFNDTCDAGWLSRGVGRLHPVSLAVDDDLDLVGALREGLAAKGQAELDGGDARLGTQIGLGDFAAGTAQVLLPAGNGLGADPVAPGAVDADAQIGDAVVAAIG